MSEALFLLPFKLQGSQQEASSIRLGRCSSVYPGNHICMEKIRSYMPTAKTHGQPALGPAVFEFSLRFSSFLSPPTCLTLPKHTAQREEYLACCPAYPRSGGLGMDSQELPL